MKDFIEVDEIDFTGDDADERAQIHFGQFAFDFVPKAGGCVAPLPLNTIHQLPFLAPRRERILWTNGERGGG